MTESRVKELLFDIAAQIDRAKTFNDYTAYVAKYRALKTKWNAITNNAILCVESDKNKLANYCNKRYTNHYTNRGLRQ